MNRKTAITIILLATAIVFLCLNLFVPYYDDDIWYALRYIPEETLSPITQFYDILISQYHHYMGENSRAIVHIVLQSILAVLPDWGFDILNTLVFLLLIACTTRYTQSPNEKIQPLPLLLTIAGIYWLLPDMDYLYYWAAGSLNYMWTSLASVLFLLYWQNATQANSSVNGKTWLCAVATLCCASLHEAFALPIGGAILLYMLYHYRRIGYNTLTVISIAYGLGCMTILLAPGLENKASNIGYEGIYDYITSVIISLHSLRVFPLCAIIFGVSLCKKSWRREMQTFIKENSFIILTAIIALGFVLSIRAGAQTMRIYYAAEFFALLPLLRYLNIKLSALQDRVKRGITIAISTLLIAWAVIVLPECNHTGKQHHALVMAHRHDSDGVIFLPEENTSRLAAPWVMNLHQYYYLAPEAEWRAFVTPLVELKDTLAVRKPIMQLNPDRSYQLHNRYIQIIPHELEAAIETPDEFFTPQHKIAGNNPFYGTTGGDYIITHIDSTSTHDEWYWHYHPASLQEPSASVAGLLRRAIAPETFSQSEQALFPDTVILPTQECYIIYHCSQYRRIKSLEPNQ